VCHGCSAREAPGNTGPYKHVPSRDPRLSHLIFRRAQAPPGCSCRIACRITGPCRILCRTPTCQTHTSQLSCEMILLPDSLLRDATPSQLPLLRRQLHSHTENGSDVPKDRKCNASRCSHHGQAGNQACGCLMLAPPRITDTDVAPRRPPGASHVPNNDSIHRSRSRRSRSARGA
jgi:hypothetical protein